MKNSILTALLLMFSSIAWADIILQPGESASETITCAVGDGECYKLPGNAHATTHSKLAAQNGYATCAECHMVGGSAVTDGQSCLCSQFDFAWPGIVAIDPRTGEVLVDPVTGEPVISGGPIACYDNMSVVCKDCHYPHDTQGVKVEKRDIHEGCLDCHREVGSGKLKKGVDDEDSGDEDSGD